MSGKTTMMRRALMVVLATVATASSYGVSCNGDGEDTTAASGAGGNGGATLDPTTVVTSATGSGGAPSECPPRSIPPEVPEGWVEWTDWSCDCRFYIPTQERHLPAPIAWEPCSVDTGTQSCEEMLVDWTEVDTPVDYTPLFDRRANGKGSLLFRRLNDDYSLYLVADTEESRVHFAAMQVLADGDDISTPDIGCYLVHESNRGGMFAYRARGHDRNGTASESAHEGLIVGESGELVPRVVQRFEDDKRYVYRVSESVVVRGSDPTFEYLAMPWSLAPESLVTSPASDPDGLTASQMFVEGDAVFFQTGTLKIDRVNVWEEATGARPLLGTPGDYTQGAADLGTDGVDLVWTWGEGKAPNDNVYPTRSIMTAPYTTDPGSLQPRRLRSQPDTSMGIDMHVVGCGYSAHRGGAADSLVVRLSDGWSWPIPSNLPELRPNRPIGITCEHVYIIGGFGGRTNIARFRLDSLGPGVAPD